MMKRITTLLLIAIVAFSAYSQTEIKAEKLKEHLFYLASDELEGRGWSTPAGLEAAHYIADYFKKSGIKPVGENYLHPFIARSGQTALKGNNVVGIIEGSDPVLKNEYIVLGAHYDHVSYRMRDGEKIVYNGADDNASGTATIMEIGKALVKGKAELKRSIILVAFDAEESGLIGSGKFVEQEIVPIDQIKVMFSIDMVGRLAESNSLIMGALDDLKGASEILLALAKEKDVKIKKTGGAVSMRTDTKPFGDVGVPAVYVSSGIVGPYHKPEDDPETLDYDGMAQINNLLAEFTVILANKDELKPIITVAAQTDKSSLPFFRFGVKANLGGSSHIYPNEFYKAKACLSGEAGLMTQLRISQNFSLQPEVLYSTMASKIEGGNYRTHGINVPVSLLFASPLQPPANQRFFLKLGGYYNYQFAGRVNGQAIDFVNDYNPIDYGITWGGGLEAMGVFVTFTAKNGLSNILLNSNDKVRTRAFYISLGLMF
jgi:aminopeptidase YwaD